MITRRVPAIAIAALVPAVLAPAAHAQFITGITKPTFGVNQPEAFFLDLADGSSTFLFDIETGVALPATAPGFGGLAGDPDNRRFFASVRNGPNDDIYAFSYDDLLNPTKLGETTLNGADEAVDGLAYDTRNGVLYGIGRLDDLIYTIDLAGGALTPFFDLTTQLGGAFDWDVSAIDHDAATGLLFIVNEDSSAEPSRAIWSYDPMSDAADLTFVVALPADVTDVDGLGAGGGVLLLVTDNANANGGEHIVYDLAAGTFSRVPSPYPAPAGTPIAPNPSAGGAYVPGLLGDAPCSGADLAEPFGTLDVFDILAFFDLFGDQDPAADLDSDGEFDIFDILAYFDLFAAGC